MARAEGLLQGELPGRAPQCAAVAEISYAAPRQERQTGDATDSYHDFRLIGAYDPPHAFITSCVYDLILQEEVHTPPSPLPA